MNYVVVDLEWNQAMSSKSSVFNKLPIKLRGEIIEIGAVKLNEDMTPGEEFTIDVKPVYDRGIMEQNIIIHDLDWDWISSWINLQLIYNMQTDGDKNQKSLATAMEHFDIEQTRVAHDALGDAYNTALVCTKLDMKSGLAQYDEATRTLATKTRKSEPGDGAHDALEHRVFPGYISKSDAFADEQLVNTPCPKCGGELNAQRDRMMAENTLWILQQEQARGKRRILISGHNNHIMQCENAGTPVLGSLLAENLGDGYFAIGTDFYKSVCNLPKPYTGKRITHTFYSYDPLAKASKKCGFDVSFLDFSKVPEGSALMEYIANSVQMGSLGEYYSILLNFVPRSYRVWRAPQDAYDAMIFVTDTAPIEIESLNK